MGEGGAWVEAGYFETLGTVQVRIVDWGWSHSGIGVGGAACGDGKFLWGDVHVTAGEGKRARRCQFQ